MSQPNLKNPNGNGHHNGLPDDPFTDEQQNYLQGFVSGADAGRSLRGLSTLSGMIQVTQGHPGNPTATESTQLTVGQTASADPRRDPEAIHFDAMQQATDAGGKLSKEEKAKRDKNPLDMWDQMQQSADQGQFPKGTDVFLYKFQGLFYVAPAQDSYMCRLRLPAGLISAAQMRGVADLAQQYGGGYSHVTTRANLQIREIGAADALHVLTGLTDLGIVNRGAGGDNVRNITASPTAGIDPDELIDTIPLAKRMHHHLLNHRELYGLPRKFNIAFDGGGSVSSVSDTNDIDFRAVRLDEAHATEQLPAGVYFRMGLGGITGHEDFAQDAGLMLRPEQCVPAADAVIRVFIAHGDRTDRKKARLKYLLDRWGHEKFLKEAIREMPFSPATLPLDECMLPQPENRLGHIGVHPQKQEGLCYVGVAVPVGRLSIEQMHGLASVAERCGSGTLRLTVWQNLLISDIPEKQVEAVQREIEGLKLAWRVSSFQAGLVACTGNTGCKYSASDTKTHAQAIADHLESRFELDSPINIHLTGCHHSCAQHYIGDIGLLGTKVDQDDDMVEGYHVYLGGGSGERQGIGRMFHRDVTADDVPTILERIVRVYLDHRGSEETFHAFTNRHDIEQLQAWFEQTEPVPA